MVQKNVLQLPVRLSACNTEEEVKSEFARAFKFKLDTRMRMDLYTPSILFEFKYDKNLQALATRSLVVSQLMYYVRQIKFGKSGLSIPPHLAGVDKNEAFFLETIHFQHIYDSDDVALDWDRAPSTPCPNIVALVSQVKPLQEVHVFKFGNAEDFQLYCEQLNYRMNFQPELDFVLADKKAITEDNFEVAFKIWSQKFGPYVENGRKASEYFLADIQDGKSVILRDSHEVAFDIGNGTLIKKSIPLDDYNHFWETFGKITDRRVLHSIWQRVDRLSVEDFRRFTGEFYTPVAFAAKGLDYIEKVVGKDWWNQGYRLWDMAAGTGNLEYSIPEEALPFCYISTLLDDDAEYCRRLYHQSTVFQYDYLNDDVNLFFHSGLTGINTGIRPKLPEKLVQDLENPDIKWIIFINPPFATSNVGSRDSEISKDAVSKTAIRDLMASENLLETSRELFSQFLWRISKEFAGKTAHLGMFSKIKYLNANNDQKMRESFFQFSFERGFCFPSTTFVGNKGSFPVGFLVWDLGRRQVLRDQPIWLDIFNSDVEKIGRKHVPSVDRDDALSKWVERPKAVAILPPMSNALTIADNHKDVRDGVAANFLFSLMAKGNDFVNQNFTALLAGPYVSAGAISVTPANFEKAMVWHAVRRLPKATWLNDRDQWMQPIKDLTPEFVDDCVIWSAFSNSNQVSSLSGVLYRSKSYELPNQLFAFDISEIQAWPCGLSSISSSLMNAKENRYLSQWLKNRTLSGESLAVIQAAKRMYEVFYANASAVAWPKYKIKSWDVGLNQVRRALQEADLGGNEISALSQSMKVLQLKLLPQLWYFGFMQGEEQMFDIDSISERTPTS